MAELLKNDGVCVGANPSGVQLLVQRDGIVTAINLTPYEVIDLVEALADEAAEHVKGRTGCGIRMVVSHV